MHGDGIPQGSESDIVQDTRPVESGEVQDSHRDRTHWISGGDKGLRTAKLIRLQLEDLTVGQLHWLQKYARDSWDHTTLKALLLQVRDGGLALWMIVDSEAQGIIGTRILEEPYGRVLWLELLVGEGLLKDAIAIRLAIHELRKGAECTSLEGIVSRPGLARLYERVLHVKPSAQIFREEF